ncbi:hypothetical protein [Dyadobacter alkalitolerans]|uniref:hypothetical protein n=1 Tax=Dyadobacter alkalitolerans TaxID=492736 RepID=UPI000686848D|nr:hypothetical protein [Dyadobacter alkalitolerans]
MDKTNKQLQRKRGRPGEYERNYHSILAFKLCCLGITDAELGFVFDVSEQTINFWKTQDEEFANSVRRGKTIADSKVAHSLFKRAMGYDQIEKATFEIQIDINKRELRTVDTVRHIPGDVRACEIWLRNRTDFFSQQRNHIDIDEIVKRPRNIAAETEIVNAQ